MRSWTHTTSSRHHGEDRQYFSCCLAMLVRQNCPNHLSLMARPTTRPPILLRWRYHEPVDPSRKDGKTTHSPPSRLDGKTKSPFTHLVLMARPQDSFIYPSWRDHMTHPSRPQGETMTSPRFIHSSLLWFSPFDSSRSKFPSRFYDKNVKRGGMISITLSYMVTYGFTNTKELISQRNNRENTQNRKTVQAVKNTIKSHSWWYIHFRWKIKGKNDKC